MTGEELWDEGQRLARPCVWLCETGLKGDHGAMWGGPGLVPPPKKGDWRHWLSIDCGWYKEVFHRDGKTLGPSTGVLSVYTDEETCEAGVAVHDPKAKFSTKGEGTVLFAAPGRCLPPIEAVFQFGSPAVKAWLKKNEWELGWDYNDNFKDKKVAKHYLKKFQQMYPLYGGVGGRAVHAMLGGWHFPWPDGDWLDLAKRQLLVCTFEDSEPWVEVWAKGKKFEALQRVT